ncbi:MAG TPA: hypothetical protein ENJ61_01930 [Aquifex aeolicus]|uniref:Uncharacterized protein n=1 Tax=Aquifex aeolicus TaxID=63363 RepID=A0A7C5L4C4_AQUAO|nr:hypothetical protein [Aquifex aeolicus]
MAKLAALVLWLLLFTHLPFAQECTQPDRMIYLGYYTENPSRNPEDPTAGMLLSCMPKGSGAFLTEFLFSYFGCLGGVNVGTVRGSRSGTSMSGQWRGTVDGASIGGGFEGICTENLCRGVWSNSKGKQIVSVGTCRYYVSPDGKWFLFGMGQGFGGLNLSIDTGASPPSISWQRVPGANHYFLYVFDRICLQKTVSLSGCTLWHAYCSGDVGRTGYGAFSGCRSIVPAAPLRRGGDYVIAVIATAHAIGGFLPGADVVAFEVRSFSLR